MSADGQVKSLIDRVLRLKEEQDALAADIREVYAEAKANGYDKTAMGAVVAHLRRIEKHGADALEERDAAFGLYLDAYERAASHTYAPAPAREIIEKFDPETGEIHDADSGQRIGRKDGEQRGSAPIQGADGRGEGADDGDQGQGAGASGTDRRVGPVEGELDCQDQDRGSRHVGGEVDHEITPSDAASSVAVAETQAPQTATAPISAMTAKSKADVIRLLRPHCRHADDTEKCGSQGGTKHCHACQMLADAEKVPA